MKCKKSLEGIVSPVILSPAPSPVEYVDSPMSSVMQLTLGTAKSPFESSVLALSPSLDKYEVEDATDNHLMSCNHDQTNAQHLTPQRADVGQNDCKMWRLDDFNLGPRIGRGMFGYVQLVQERKSGQVAVLKILKKRRVDRLHIQNHVAHEIQIQGHMKHPNILRLFGFFWDASRIYLILEHAAGGDLAGLLEKQPKCRLKEANTVFFICQLLSAIEHCHRFHVIHRDIKPHNILISHKMKLKLGDFGWAVHTYPHERRWTLCGTLDYLAPEIVNNTCGYSFGVDVWGVGIITYEMVMGQPPFLSESRENTYRQILAAQPEFPSWSSSSMQGFIRALLTRVSAQRASAAEALTHSWLQLAQSP